MSLLKLIDDLPTDILFECAKYIYLPPNKLLQEIKHYGQVKVSIELLKNYFLKSQPFCMIICVNYSAIRIP